MGKTTDLFKMIRGTKGKFHANTGSIKDRNGTDLTESEDIKKRWQEHTELCKKEKWLSGEALEIAMKRREAKSKREK